MIPHWLISYVWEINGLYEESKNALLLTIEIWKEIKQNVLHKTMSIKSSINLISYLSVK